jgi:nitrogen fixation protein FixH
MIVRQGRQPGWWIPWTFVAGFLLVVAVNGVMIWFATTSWTGLVTDRAYERGLDYNRNLEAAAAMAALGWQAKLVAATRADGSREFTLEARDKEGAPLSGLVIEGKLAARPMARPSPLDPRRATLRPFGTARPALKGAGP